MADDLSYLDFPFGIDASGRTATTDADDHVRDLIYQVLFTQPGERVNRPEFGCGLKQLVFAPASDALAAATEQLVHGALIRWLDPVILVERVSVEVDEATISVTVAYRPRGSTVQQVEMFQNTIPA